MDKAAMVSVDIGVGAEIVEALDNAQVKTNVALWAHLSEYQDWRLVLAGRPFDERDSYTLLHEALDPAGFTPSKTPIILILPMNDSFVKAIRRRYAKYKDNDGMRLSGQLFGDRFVEDGYVYRIS